MQTLEFASTPVPLEGGAGGIAAGMTRTGWFSTSVSCHELRVEFQTTVCSPYNENAYQPEKRSAVSRVC